MGDDDLEFGAGDLLKGDQAGNMPEDEDDVEFIVLADVLVLEIAVERRESSQP